MKDAIKVGLGSVVAILGCGPAAGGPTLARHADQRLQGPFANVDLDAVRIGRLDDPAAIHRMLIFSLETRLPAEMAELEGFDAQAHELQALADLDVGNTVGLLDGLIPGPTYERHADGWSLLDRPSDGLYGGGYGDFSDPESYAATTTVEKTEDGGAIITTVHHVEDPETGASVTEYTETHYDSEGNVILVYGQYVTVGVDKIYVETVTTPEGGTWRTEIYTDVNGEPLPDPPPLQPVRPVEVPIPRNPERTQPTEEDTGEFCVPYWECLRLAEVALAERQRLRTGGVRVHVLDFDGPAGPSLDVDRHGIVVNPDPSTTEPVAAYYGQELPALVNRWTFPVVIFDPPISSSIAP